MPRGPEEWGALLYDQRWSRERKYNDPKDLVMGPVIMIMGIVLIGMFVWVLMDAGEDLGVSLMLLGIGAVVILLGWGMMASEFRHVPFRVYERGFTLTPVPVSKGLRKEEVLVPVERIKKVEVESHSLYGLALRTLKVTYMDEKGEEKEDNNGYSTLDDPLRAMLAFQRIVPDRLDESVLEFVGPGTEDAVFSNPLREKGRTGRDSGRIFMVVMMVLFMTLLMASMLGEMPYHMGWRNYIIFLPFAMIFGMALAFIGMLGFLSKREFSKAASDQARVEGDAIALPRPRMALLFARARPSIPLAEVHSVRRYLEPYTWGSSAHVELASGEDLEVPREVFETLRSRAGFEREGFFVRNSRPFPGKGMPSVAPAWHRGLLLFLGPALLYLVLAFTGKSVGEALFEGDAIDDLMFYLIMFVFLVLLPLRFILGRRLSQREQLGQGFDADDRGVTIPRAPSPFTWIPRDSVGSITTEKDSMGPFVRMEAYASSIELPLVVAEKLEDAGYEVSDPLGALVRRMAPEELVEPRSPDLLAGEGEARRPLDFLGRGDVSAVEAEAPSAGGGGLAVGLPVLLSIPAVAVGLVASFYYSTDLDVLREGYRMDRALLAAFPVAILVYMFLMLVLMRADFGGRWRWRLSPAAIAAVVIAMMVAIAPVYAYSDAAVFTPSIEVRLVDELPGTTLEIRSYVGEELEVAGAITVGPGENLSLVDTRLSFRGPDEGPRGLWVAEGGTLWVDNCTIERFGHHEDFALEVRGSAIIRDSVIAYPSNRLDDAKVNRGIVVLSDDVKVVNTTFEGRFTSAIMAYEASTEVLGCTFTGLEEDGVFARKGSATIKGCTFTTCEYPIVLFQGEATVSGCTFVECRYAVALWQGEADVQDCVITNTTRAAFLESPESEVRTQGNTYNDVGNMTRDYPLYYSQKDTCLVTTLVVGLLSMAILVSANGHRPRREDQGLERRGR